MNRKELLGKRTKLFEEINTLVKERGKCKKQFELNKTIEEKRAKYKFYSNLLKNMK